MLQPWKLAKHHHDRQRTPNSQTTDRKATGQFLCRFGAQHVSHLLREPRLLRARLSKTEIGASNPEEHGLRPE